MQTTINCEILERSPVYSDHLFAKLCQFLREGATRTAAAQAVGIHKDTLYHWMNVSSEVSDAVLRAEGEFRAELEKKFAVHALNGEDWRAAHAFLQSHPRTKQDWGQQINLAQVPTERLREILTGEVESAEPAWPVLQALEAAPAELPADQPDAIDLPSDPDYEPQDPTL